MSSKSFIAACILILPTFVATNAQNDRMVMLSVRVTDKHKRPITDIRRERFQLYEDGIAQKIELFSGDEASVTYGLVIDNSGSLRSQFSDVVLAGMRIVNSNTVEDQAFIVRFVGSDRLEVMQECTFDKKLLISGLQSMHVERGQTALIDALYLAAEKLTKLEMSGDKSHRRALIVVTDGEDRQSYYKASQLFDLLAPTDIQVFVIGLTSEVEAKNRDRAVDFINRLAMETGGRAFFPDSSVDLDLVSEAIINHIRTQYSFGYVPANTSAEFHKLQIAIAGLPADESIIAITNLRYLKRVTN